MSAEAGNHREGVALSGPETVRARLHQGIPQWRCNLIDYCFKKKDPSAAGGECARGYAAGLCTAAGFLIPGELAGTVVLDKKAVALFGCRGGHKRLEVLQEYLRLAQRSPGITAESWAKILRGEKPQ
jgi:hypothetical protein